HRHQIGCRLSSGTGNPGPQRRLRLPLRRANFQMGRRRVSRQGFLLRLRFVLRSHQPAGPGAIPMTPAKDHYAIVGGGMLGLALAWRLSGQGYRVTVLEASDHLGGLADAWELGDITWDRHYHVTLLSDSYLRTIL